jgi:hypothetical protein
LAQHAGESSEQPFSVHWHFSGCALLLANIRRYDEYEKLYIDWNGKDKRTSKAGVGDATTMAAKRAEMMMIKRIFADWAWKTIDW